MKIRYLTERNGVRRYRRMVPPALRHKLGGRREWVRSFRSGTPIAQVLRQVEALAHLHDIEIARARGQHIDAGAVQRGEARARRLLTGDKRALHETLAEWATRFPDETGMSPSLRVASSAIFTGGTYRETSLPLSQVYANDLRLYGGTRDETPIKAAVDRFIRDVGDRDIREIRPGEVADWLASVKDWKAGTIARRVGALRAIWNRAARLNEVTTRNPFEKLNLGEGGSATDRLPLNRAMLALIDAHLMRPRVRTVTRQLIALMKYTGCGPAEIGGLVLNDVVMDAPIPYIWIRPNGVRGLKVEGDSPRSRRIPLVGTALEAAREATQRAKVKSKGSAVVQLFPAYRGNANGISAVVNKALRTAGIPKSPRLTAYSYRHTLKEALRSAGVADHIQRRLLGHAGAGVADRYGSPAARLEEKVKALTAALDYLGDVDESIYSGREQLRG